MNSCILIFVVFAVSLGAASCGSKDSSGGGDNPVGRRLKTEQIAEALVSTRWCGEDTDGDASIGTFVFGERGAGVWQGWNTKTNKFYDESPVRWSVDGELLTWNFDYPDAKVEVRRVEIFKEGTSLRMTWTVEPDKNGGRRRSGTDRSCVLPN